MYLPEGDKYSTQKKEALANLIVTMGGRIAESFHSATMFPTALPATSARPQRSPATWSASGGCPTSLGMIEYGEGDSPVFLGRGDIGRRPNYSSYTARIIDEEIKYFIDDAFRQATEILTAARDKVELIAMALLEFETLEGSQIHEIVDHGEMRNPPQSAPPADPGAKPPLQSTEPPARPADEELPPAGLTGQPA
jgi:cell division protease FtsH